MKNTLFQSIWKYTVVSAMCCIFASCASNAPYGTWLWNNQTLPEQVGLDDSVFVALIDELPGVELDSVFYMLSDVGYGPTKLYSGPSRIQDNFGVEGINYTYKDSSGGIFLEVYIYADKYYSFGVDWDDILDTHVKQVDVLHIDFGAYKNISDSTNQRKPREKTGYRVTHDSREWFGPDDNWR